MVGDVFHKNLLLLPKLRYKNARIDFESMGKRFLKSTKYAEYVGIIENMETP